MKIKYKILEDVALADIAIEAYGKNLNELFENSAFAIFDETTDLRRVEEKEKKIINVETNNLENLLFDFLSEIYGHTPREWVIAYPYGNYNSMTIELLKQAGCALGLTTSVGLASDLSSPLDLPRLDTNDIPLYRDAAPCEWTQKAKGGTVSSW